MGGILIKMILGIISIYLSLVYSKRHFSNYLIANGKYPTYYMLFTRGWSHLG
jgi:hypothetical protein